MPILDTATCQALRPLLVTLLLSGLSGKPPLASAHCSLPPRYALQEPMWRDMEILVQRHNCQSLFAEGCRVARIWLGEQGLSVPAEMLRQACQARLITGVRLVRAREQCRVLLDKFQAHGIDPLFLKGMLLAERHYRDATLRPFSDIDILIRPEQREQAAQLLSDLGYRLTEDEMTTGEFAGNNFHAPYTRDGHFPVELHWDFTPAKSPVRIPLEHIWDRSIVYQSAIGPARVLSAEDEMIFLAVHVARHHFAAPLRGYLDFAALHHAVPDLSWDVCLARADAWGAGMDFAATLAATAELGCLELPPAVEMALRACLPGRMKPALLASYALAWPFIDLPYRLLDTAMDRSPLQIASRVWSLLFPPANAVSEEVSPSNMPTRRATAADRNESSTYAARWMARAGYWVAQLGMLARNRKSMSGAYQIHRTLQDRHIMNTRERKKSA